MTRALLLVLILVGCSSNEPRADEEILHGCPPAPLGSPGPSRCDFEGSCRYATPNGLLLGRPDGCNPVTCSCRDGQVVCEQNALGCSAPSVVKCVPSVTDGASCVLPGNGECERVEGDKRYACACDNPGPKWRCFAVP